MINLLYLPLILILLNIAMHFANLWLQVVTLINFFVQRIFIENLYLFDQKQIRGRERELQSITLLHFTVCML